MGRRAGGCKASAEAASRQQQSAFVAELAAAEAEAEQRGAASAGAQIACLQQLLMAEEARARDFEEKLRIVEQEARQATKMAEESARRIRAGGMARGLDRAAQFERGVLMVVVGSWRTQIIEGRLQTEADKRQQVEATENAAETGRRLAVHRAGLAETAAAEESARLRARAAAAEARLSCAEALREAAAEEADRLRREIEDRQRAKEEQQASETLEQEVRHRGELAIVTALAQANEQLALKKQAEEAEQQLEEEIARSARALREWTARVGPELRGGEASGARLRAFSGASALAVACNKAHLMTIMTAWQTRVGARKAVGSLQAKLFSEQAGRAAAMRSQKLELDTRYMEAEARHRAAMRRLRQELAEVETRHADALSQQEIEAATRLAAAEADFSNALRGAVTTEGVTASPRSIAAAAFGDDEDGFTTREDSTEDGGIGESSGLVTPSRSRAGSSRAGVRPSESQHNGASDSSPGDAGATGEAGASVLERAPEAGSRRASSPSSPAAQPSGEVRLTEVLRALRARAEARLADTEVRHAEALLSERERADLRLAREERRHEEALRVARESSERRVAALEQRHTEALRLVQEDADCRVREAEESPAKLHSSTSLLDTQELLESCEVNFIDPGGGEGVGGSADPDD